MSLSQPIRSKTETNCEFLARVFPRLPPATCINFASSSDWFNGLSASVVIRHGDLYFCFVLRDSFKNRSIEQLKELQLILSPTVQMNLFSHTHYHIHHFTGI